MSKAGTDKSDNDLGEKVHQHLVGLGLETPMVQANSFDQFRPNAKQEQIEAHVFEILTALGLDLKDDSLCDTPKRVAKMFLNELFYGLDYANFPKATVVENKMRYDEMVLERRIAVKSTCEHHVLPILGFAHVAYVPKNKVLGLSKLNRIVDFFARRPQIQERLTAQVTATLQFLLDTDDVAVCIDAEHMCVKTRGVEDACSDTVTSKLGGEFKTNPSMRQEFFSLININK
jgi:GTP cyclohydrolase I